ncbi:hypothetical protein A7K91_19275 [Paenibacillus oryzae]|uniref:Group-specific protein n=1 Tax=Paenibacillus oryzae TaxID=1844972 RepID=A0A1A5YP15_9BACL|nr:hypothetical protein [Paenibacillus oryzae]OBR67361.1 hypothetical protein A7K91_19275 [Paenibacillus oryzae]
MNFHPTVFENIKVALENELYDMDNLDGLVTVSGRSDLMDMAVMGRELSLRFTLPGQGEVEAEVVLSSSLRELAAELLAEDEDRAAADESACRLRVRFHLELEREDEQCQAIEHVLLHIWQPTSRPAQTVSKIYGASQNSKARCTAEIHFDRGIGEEQMEDIPELLRHMAETLKELGRLL